MKSMINSHLKAVEQTKAGNQLKYEDDSEDMLLEDIEEVSKQLDNSLTESYGDSDIVRNDNIESQTSSKRNFKKNGTGMNLEDSWKDNTEILE